MTASPTPENESTAGADQPAHARHPITLLSEWPLPTSQEGVAALWEHSDQLQHDYESPPHPDELNERYVDVVCETPHWRVFHIGLYAFPPDLYFWTRYGDYGFRVSTLENDVALLAEALTAVAGTLGLDDQ
jgi:hypothetical protein